VALFSPLRRPDVVATDLGEAVRLILAHHE